MIPPLDIPISRFRVRRNNTKGDQFAISSKRERSSDASVEGWHILNQVIGSQDQKNGIISFLQCLQRGQGNGWCRVTANWFKKDSGLLNIQLTQLLGSKKAVLFIANQVWPGNIQPL